MAVLPTPVVYIAGRKIAGHVLTGDWNSLVLDGLTIDPGSRSSPVDEPSWPTAELSILTNEVPDYLASTPVGREAKIKLFDKETPIFTPFRGFVDSAKVKAVRTKLAGHEYMFRVDMSLISRPAALSNIVFSQHKYNNRPAESLAFRMTWMEKALQGTDHPYIRPEFYQSTPLFTAPTWMDETDWPYRVGAKDYRGSSVLDALLEMIRTTGCTPVYTANSNRIYAMSRVPVTRNFLALGRQRGMVNMVSRGGGGSVWTADQFKMDDTSYSDVGRVARVRVPMQSGDSTVYAYALTDSTDASAVADVSTLAVYEPDRDGYDPALATAARVRYLYNDAVQPVHPNLTFTYKNGWASVQEARLFFSSDPKAFGPLYIANSVFNRLRKKGIAFHTRGSVKLTWERTKKASDARQWTVQIGLLPNNNVYQANRLLVNQINPSATAQNPATMTYATIPNEPTFAEHATELASSLAASLAATTSTAFTYDEIYPRLSINEMASAVKGI